MHSTPRSVICPGDLSRVKEFRVHNHIEPVFKQQQARQADDRLPVYWSILVGRVRGHSLLPGVTWCRGSRAEDTTAGAGVGRPGSGLDVGGGVGVLCAGGGVEWTSHDRGGQGEGKRRRRPSVGLPHFGWSTVTLHRRSLYNL